MFFSEVCRSRERLRGVVGSEGNATAVLGQGINVGFNRQWDRWRQSGVLHAEEASAGRLSTSAPAVGTAHAALISSDAQGAKERQRGLGGIGVATAGAATVLTRRRPAAVTLAAAVLGTGGLREMHGGHDWRQRLRRHAARGASAAGGEVVRQDGVVVVAGWAVVVVHGGRRPVAPHVRERWESGRGGAARHMTVQRHLLGGQQDVCWGKRRRAGAEQQCRLWQHAADGRQCGAGRAFCRGVQGAGAAGMGVIAPVTTVIICTKKFLSVESSA